MTPRSFDLATCREYIGDERARYVEGKARADAEAGNYAPPPHTFQTPSGKAHEDMEDIVYQSAYKKRMDRIERMADRQPTIETASPADNLQPADA